MHEGSPLQFPLLDIWLNDRPVSSALVLSAITAKNTLTASLSQASVVDNRKQTVLVVWGRGNFYDRPGVSGES